VPAAGATEVGDVAAVSLASSEPPQATSTANDVTTSAHQAAHRALGSIDPPFAVAGPPQKRRLVPSEIADGTS
jgi:hypothetical protein